jgi:uncharacterized phage protein gp47/JayE
MALEEDGLQIKSQPEIEAELDEALRTNISPTLNVGSTSILGQLKGITSSHLSELWDGLQALWLSWDISSASGAALDRLVGLTGTVRRPASPSTVLMTLDLDAGTYPAGSLIVSLVNDGNVRFVNRDDIVLGSDSPALVGVPFVSENDGPVQAGSGQLTVIVNPVLGFNSATNPNDAEEGSLRETDAELRARRNSELARKGSTTVDAIRADILNVPGVTFARVIENASPSPVGGIPAHAFEALVLGGEPEDIAEAIFLTKPAGIQAYGSTVISVADSQGAGHSIGFSRPVDKNVFAFISLTYIGGQFIGTEALKTRLSEWGDASLGPGNDVLLARVIQQVMSVPGVVDAQVLLGPAMDDLSAANFVVGVREIARMDPSRIEIVAHSVVGAP